MTACRECGGRLVEAAAPERRAPAPTPDARMRVVASLPAEDALLASGRLEDGGIAASLRDAGGAFDVLVPEERIADARALLIRAGKPSDPAHSQTLLMIAVVTGAALMLSAALFVARWLLSGSPIPR